MKPLNSWGLEGFLRPWVLPVTSYRPLCSTSQQVIRLCCHTSSDMERPLCMRLILSLPSQGSFYSLSTYRFGLLVPVTFMEPQGTS